MSVIIDKNRTWKANKWISFKLFNDFLMFVNKDSELGRKILFLNKVSIDTLDLTEFDNVNQKLFTTVFKNVLEYNLQTKGTDMADPSYFSLYKNKLFELKSLIDQYN